MPRHIGALAPDRMTDQALWDRVQWIASALRWQSGYTLSEREHFLDQLEDCVRELKLRGVQLSIELEDQTADSR
jgi:hypothetical protein